MFSVGAIVVVMDVRDKLRILASAARYDASCASSGSKGRGEAGKNEHRERWCKQRMHGGVAAGGSDEFR